jgi:hypothetical protein
LIFILIYFILIIFLLLFNIFLKYYWRSYQQHNFVSIFQRIEKELLQMPLLLMGLPMELDRRYILESWKRITANAIVTVNAPMELQIVLCRWYVIFTDGYINRIKLVIFFGTLCSFINPSIYLLPINSSTVHKLLMKVFFDGLFLLVSLSVTY